MITEFKTIPKAVYYVQTADGCTVLDPDGDTLAEITAPGGYFPGIAAADGGPGTVTFSAPVKRVVGPFDLAPQLLLTILGQLGGNAGDKGGLPAGFKRVEYIESTGTQYIDTGLVVESDFNAVLKGLWKRENNRGDVYFVGAVARLGSNFLEQYRIITAWAIPPNCPVLDFGTGWVMYRFSENSITEIGAHIPVLYVNEAELIVNRETLAIDNIEVLQMSPTDLRTSLALGGVSINGAVNETGIIVGRFYSAEFSCRTSNGAKNMNLVPCLDPTGSPCMFDLVSRKSFYNQGAGDYLYPTESATYSLRRVLPDWGKLTEHGLRRLYHSPANYQGELIDYALENGFKPIVETEQPVDGYWAPRWRETEDEIVLEWVETEPLTMEYLTQPTE